MKQIIVIFFLINFAYPIEYFVDNDSDYTVVFAGVGGPGVYLSEREIFEILDLENLIEERHNLMFYSLVSEELLCDLDSDIEICLDRVINSNVPKTSLEQASYIKKNLNERGIVSYDLIGYSYSANTAIDLAFIDREKVKSLLLVSPANFHSYTPDILKDHRLLVLDRLFESRSELLEIIEKSISYASEVSGVSIGSAFNILISQGIFSPEKEHRNRNLSILLMLANENPNIEFPNVIDEKFREDDDALIHYYMLCSEFYEPFSRLNRASSILLSDFSEISKLCDYLQVSGNYNLKEVYQDYKLLEAPVTIRLGVNDPNVPTLSNAKYFCSFFEKCNLILDNGFHDFEDYRGLFKKHIER